MSEARKNDMNSGDQEFPLSLRIVSVGRETDQIIALTLERPDGGDLPEWSPGSHLEVELPSGLFRHYSLSGDPHDRKRYEIAVLREEAGRGGSKELHAVAALGIDIRVAELRNRFPLRSAPHYLFLAGGIGLTPLLPMIRAAQEAGSSWRLVYGGRSRSTMAFLDRVEALQGGEV